MNPRRKRRLITLSIVLCGIAVAASLLLYALSSNLDHFYTPSQIVEGKTGPADRPSIGQRLRIGGMVIPGTVKRDAQSLRVQFDLIDTGPIVTVVYDGVLPDLFREGQGIVATGVLTGPREIEAFEVLAKHDEEYMPPELKEAMDKVGHQPTTGAPQ